MQLYIGTSGWSYEHWNQIFYPKDIKSNQRLQYYGKHFDTVEINTTFYHLPKNTTINNWNNQVPKKFIFSIKASQYITHRKRLKDPSQTLTLFFERIKLLENKTGVILFQLPPSFKKNIERLEEFINHLDKDKRYTFEFRHESWFEEEVYSLLKKHNIALCITDWADKSFPEVMTADFAYVRLHGPQKTYQGFYGPKKLKEWKKKFLEWMEHKMDIYCYFDNDEKAYAIKDAYTLKKLFSQK